MDFRDDWETGSFEEDDANPESEEVDRSDRHLGSRLMDDYMREVRATPLLEREEEVRLATEFRQSREHLAEVLLSLPEPWAEIVLGEDREGPRRGRRWPLKQLEASFQQLLECAEEPGSESIAALVQEAKTHKRRLDRSRETLLRSNLRLVIHLAKKLKGRGIPFLDLIQEGNLGLMTGLEKYECERGNRFSTYAVWWIRNTLFKAVAEKNRLIRLPEHVKAAVGAVRREMGDLSGELGRRPTEKELADRMDLPVEKVIELLTVVKDPRPLENFGAESDRPQLVTQVPDTKVVDPLKRTLNREMRKNVTKALRILGPSEERVIRLRFGMDGEAPMSLRQIGEVCDLSHERVRQIQRAAIRKLRAAKDSLFGNSLAAMPLARETDSSGNEFRRLSLHLEAPLKH
jgi:RNA polymerase primary sigma factor